MDALDPSSAAVILTQANPKAVCKAPRNISDVLIKAVVEQGGTIGVVGFPGFVSGEARPTRDQFIDPIAQVAVLVGIEPPDKLANLTTAMLARGFAPEDIRKAYSENLIALYRKVWGAREYQPGKRSHVRSI